MRSPSVAAAVVALISLLAEPATAAIHVVKVGDGGLTFDPNTVVAAVKDTVTFDFYPQNHSVVAGNPDKACTPSNGGFYSGFIASQKGASETRFSIIINDTNPIAFYCSQQRHCQGGMVGVINPNDKVSLKAFQASAAKAEKAESPSGGVAGGVLNRGGQTVTDAGQSATAGPSGSGSSSSASATASGASAGASSTSSGIAAGHKEVGGLLGVVVGFVALLGI